MREEGEGPWAPCGCKERVRAVGGGWWKGGWRLGLAAVFLVIAAAAADDDDNSDVPGVLALCVVGRAEEGPALALALHTVLRALPGTGVS